MTLLAHLRAMIDEMRYEGVPPKVTKPKPSRSPTQVGALTARQIQWCDDNLCVDGGEKKFKRYREQAEAARGLASR